MCLIASSTLLTSLKDTILSPYSIEKSCGFSTIFTPALHRAFLSSSIAEKSLCTKIVSTALQALGYWILASTQTLSAKSVFALSSTKIWQIPEACPKTGIFVFSWIYFTSLFEPRGIIKSTYSSSSKSALISSRENTRFIAFFGKFSTVFNASLIIFSIAALVLLDSLPPFKITALPDFIAREAIWEITSGRASKITPITPIGQETFFKIKPSSSSFVQKTLFTGSFKEITSSIPFNISRILFSSNFKRA